MTGNRTATNTCSICIFDGPEIRIDRCDKGTTEIMANVTDANDNAPISYALAA